LEAPGVGASAARIVDVRQEGGAKTLVGPARTGTPRTTTIGEQVSELTADGGRIVAVTADTRRQTNRVIAMLAVLLADTRTTEKQSIIELLNEAREIFEG